MSAAETGLLEDAAQAVESIGDSELDRLGDALDGLLAYAYDVKPDWLAEIVVAGNYVKSLCAGSKKQLVAKVGEELNLSEHQQERLLRSAWTAVGDTEVYIYVK